MFFKEKERGIVQTSGIAVLALKKSNDCWQSYIEPNKQRKGLHGSNRGYLQDLYDCTVLLLDLGCRYSELASLKWKDTDLVNGCVRMWRSKVNNESVLFLTDRAKAILRRKDA